MNSAEVFEQSQLVHEADVRSESQSRIPTTFRHVSRNPCPTARFRQMPEFPAPRLP